MTQNCTLKPKSESSWIKIHKQWILSKIKHKKMKVKKFKIEAVQSGQITKFRDYHFKISKVITIVTQSKEECLTSHTWVLVECL